MHSPNAQTPDAAPPSDVTATPDDTLLYHHFDDLTQQKDSTTLGMWAFLATEVMLFGGFFTAYAVLRAIHPDDFAAASRHLNVPLGAINTAVLLCSSLTMALAVHASQSHRRRDSVRYLLWTIGLGAAFLGVKGYEWSVDYRERLIPGVNFDWAHAEAASGRADPANNALPLGGLASSRETAETQVGPGPESPSSVPSGRAQLFFILYFLMTGLHAFHMIIGIALVGTVAWLTHRGWLSGGGETHIEITGLYWHFIDVVWVFLYPLLYLIDRAR